MSMATSSPSFKNSTMCVQRFQARTEAVGAKDWRMEAAGSLGRHLASQHSQHES